MRNSCVMEASCQDFETCFLSNVQPEVFELIMLWAEFRDTGKDLKDEIEELLRIDVILEGELLVVFIYFLVDVVRGFIVSALSVLDLLRELFNLLIIGDIDTAC